MSSELNSADSFITPSLNGTLPSVNDDAGDFAAGSDGHFEGAVEALNQSGVALMDGAVVPATSTQEDNSTLSFPSASQGKQIYKTTRCPQSEYVPVYRS